MYKYKDLVAIKDLKKEEIIYLLNMAKEMKEAVKNNDYRNDDFKNYSAMTLFYENSTRTKMSFLLACEYLGVKVVDLNVATSSKNKGESLLDTGLNIDEMGTDLVIIRHSITGTSKFLSKNLKASIVNCGDGANEHPTQCLLDLFTIKERFQKFEGLNVVIVGDVKHSRVARSNAFALKTLGANVTFCAPMPYMIKDIENFGVKVSNNLTECVKDADVIMTLRVQKERQKINYICHSEYNKFFGITSDVLKYAKDNVMIMHPGPINRGVEISSEVADGDKSVILPQVENGVAVRMAVIKTLLENRRRGTYE